jgi:hypothetical protein
MGLNRIINVIMNTSYCLFVCVLVCVCVTGYCDLIRLNVSEYLPVYINVLADVVV